MVEAVIRLRTTQVVMLACVLVSLAAPFPVKADGPFGPLRLGVNRSSYVGKCPVEVIFTANVNLNMPHPQGLVFNYHWERSDGVKTEVQVVKPEDQQRMLIYKSAWNVGAAGNNYNISETFFVNSGNTHQQVTSNTVKISCK